MPLAERARRGSIDAVLRNLPTAVRKKQIPPRYARPRKITELNQGRFTRSGTGNDIATKYRCQIPSVPFGRGLLRRPLEKGEKPNVVQLTLRLQGGPRSKAPDPPDCARTWWIRCA